MREQCDEKDRVVSVRDMVLNKREDDLRTKTDSFGKREQMLAQQEIEMRASAASLEEREKVLIARTRGVEAAESFAMAREQTVRSREKEVASYGKALDEVKGEVVRLQSAMAKKKKEMEMAQAAWQRERDELGKATQEARKAAQAQAADTSAHESLRGELQVAKAGHAGATRELARVRDELATATEESKRDSLSLTSAREQLTAQTMMLENTRGNVVVAQEALAVAEDERDAAREDLASARAELEAVRAELEPVRTELEAVRAEREAVRTDLEAVQTEREAVRTELEAVRTELEAVRACQTTQAKLEHGGGEALADAKEELATAEAAIKQLKDALAEQREEVMSLASELQHAQQQQGAGQRYTHRGGSSDDDAEALAEARAEAQRLREQNNVLDLDLMRMSKALEDTKSLNAALYARLSGSADDSMEIPAPMAGPEVDTCEQETQTATILAERLAPEVSASTDADAAAELKEAEAYIAHLKANLEKERAIVMEQAAELEHFHDGGAARPPAAAFGKESSDGEDAQERIQDLEDDLQSARRALAMAQHSAEGYQRELEEMKSANSRLYTQLSTPSPRPPRSRAPVSDDDELP